MRNIISGSRLLQTFNISLLPQFKEETAELLSTHKRQVHCYYQNKLHRTSKFIRGVRESSTCVGRKESSAQVAKNDKDIGDERTSLKNKATR